MILPLLVFPDQPLTHSLSMCLLKFIWFLASRHFCLSLMFFSTAWVHKCGANYVFHSKYFDSFTNVRHEQLCPGMGEIINMPVIDLGNYHIGFWNCNIKIENYRITFLLFSLVDERSSKNIERIQFDTNVPKMVPFRDISKLYHYMSQFSICTWFLYSKTISNQKIL